MPHPYSSVTSTPKGARLDETAPQPLQSVPQPSATNSQALLNESTARCSAWRFVSQGDQMQSVASNATTASPENLFLSMNSLFFNGRVWQSLCSLFLVVYTFRYSIRSRNVHHQDCHRGVD